MTIKAKMKVALFANDLVLAESEDPELWQNVFEAIRTKTLVTPKASPADGSGVERVGSAGSAVDKLAKLLGIDLASLKAACDPSTVSPYIHLDARCWEQLKKNTPPRGPGSVAPSQLAGTLLALWMKAAGLGAPTMAQVLEVMGTVGLHDKNALRAVRNCPWLQIRGGNVQVNPTETTAAQNVVVAYCTKRPIE